MAAKSRYSLKGRTRGSYQTIAQQFAAIPGRGKGSLLNRASLTPWPLASSVSLHVLEAHSPLERSISVMSLFHSPQNCEIVRLDSVRKFADTRPDSRSGVSDDAQDRSRILPRRRRICSCPRLARRSAPQGTTQVPRSDRTLEGVGERPSPARSGLPPRRGLRAEGQPQPRPVPDPLLVPHQDGRGPGGGVQDCQEGVGQETATGRESTGRAPNRRGAGPRSHQGGQGPPARRSTGPSGA